ncbi:MAG: ABC transporter ATP-binding protein [Anaerolineae bacterium]|nr:ABC transporter ATP-binding protein [Anaerolineae bacterium]
MATATLDSTRTQSDVSDSALLWMLARFLRPYWKALLAVGVMLVSVSALGLLPPYLIQQAVDGPITHNDLNGLVPLGIIYLGSIVLLFLLRFGSTYLLQTAGQNALVDLRQVLFDHIVEQDMHFFNLTPVGQLVARMSNDIEALTELVSTSFVVVVTNLITVAGIVLVMLGLNWRLALIGLAVLPIMLAATIYFRKRIRANASRYHKTVADYLAYVNEQLGGMLVVQLFGLQERSRGDFDIINMQVRDVHSEWRDTYTAYASVLQVLTSIGMALVLWGGGQGVLAGWATLGMLIAFVEYSRRSFEPLLQLADQVAQIQTALAAGDRIARMLQVEPGIRDGGRKIDPARVERSISLEHVQFSYDPGTPVLRDVTLTIPAGQRVAIVGATGAGKTSLAGLLTRLYDVDSGRVCIGGIDVRDISQTDLRALVTVVPQNPYCFDGTVAENLCLFRDDISEDAMRRAAEMARAAPFIERLPGGYQYKLLPGGADLSQGQRQLLALARALLHSPDSVLVLDEATSSIDTETEELIQQALESALHGRTSVIIAHRLSTVHDADRILVMRRGQIVEDGSHDVLLKKGGLYARLYRRQFEAVR